MANTFKLQRTNDIYVPQDDADDGSDDDGGNKDLCRSKIVIFINQSLCPYYRCLYGLVKDNGKSEGIIHDSRSYTESLK